jgi:hypothetical protein
MKNLQEYLIENYKNNIIDFSLRAAVDSENNTSFYIHPSYKSGDTLDFVVDQNTLIPAQFEQSDGGIVVWSAKEINKEKP